MKLARISPEAAKTITDQELFDRISSDLLDYDDWVPNPQWIYIGVFVDGLIGFFMLHAETDSMLSVHVNILKEHRSHGRKAVDMLIDAFNNDFDESIRKLTARIPVIYPEVIRFTERAGFEKEGLCKKSIMKNGELVDQVIMGLQRVEK